MNSSEERLKEAVGRLLGSVLLPLHLEQELLEALTASESTDLDRLVGWLERQKGSASDMVMNCTNHIVKTRYSHRRDTIATVQEYIAEEFGVGGDDES